MFDCEHYFDGFSANQNYSLACAKLVYEAKSCCVILYDTNGGTSLYKTAKIVAVIVGRPAAYVLFSRDRGEHFVGPWCFNMSRERAGWWGMHGCAHARPPTPRPRPRPPFLRRCLPSASLHCCRTRGGQS